MGDTGTGACPFGYADHDTYLAAQAVNAPTQRGIGVVGRTASDEARTAGEPDRRADGCDRFEDEDRRFVAGVKPTA